MVALYASSVIESSKENVLTDESRFREDRNIIVEEGKQQIRHKLVQKIVVAVIVKSLRSFEDLAM